MLGPFFTIVPIHLLPCHSHAEVCAMHHRNGFERSAHFDLCCRFAPKDI